MRQQEFCSKEAHIYDVSGGTGAGGRRDEGRLHRRRAGFFFWMQESTLPNATAFRRERAACAVIFPDKKADSTAFLLTILRIKTIGDFRAC